MFTLGVPDALTFFTAGRKLEKEQAVPLAITGGMLCAGIAMATLWSSSFYLFRNQPAYLPEFHWLLLSLGVTLIFSSLRGIAQGFGDFPTINREKTVGAILRLLCLAMLFAISALTPLRAVWISVATGILASLLLIPSLRCRPITNVSWIDIKSLGRYAAAAAFGTLGGLIVIRLDQVLMVSLTTRAELAFYAVAASLAELPLSIVGGVRDVAFTESAKQSNPEVIARFSRLSFAAMSIICVAAAAITPLLLPLLFGKAFSPAIAMAEVLLIATLGRAITAVMGAGLMTTNRTWLRSGIQLGGALLTALLLYAWVPRWGGMAAAWVTTITYLALAIASTSVYARTTGVSMKACLVPTKPEWIMLCGLITAITRKRLSLKPNQD